MSEPLPFDIEELASKQLRLEFLEEKKHAMFVSRTALSSQRLEPTEHCCTTLQSFRLGTSVQQFRVSVGEVLYCGGGRFLPKPFRSEFRKRMAAGRMAGTDYSDVVAASRAAELEKRRKEALLAQKRQAELERLANNDGGVVAAGGFASLDDDQDSDEINVCCVDNHLSTRAIVGARRRTCWALDGGRVRWALVSSLTGLRPTAHP
jgi:hypothetical protein